MNPTAMSVGPMNRPRKPNPTNPLVFSSLLDSGFSLRYSRNDQMEGNSDFFSRLLSEEAERRQRRVSGAVLVWDNRETQTVDLEKVEAQVFELMSGFAPPRPLLRFSPSRRRREAPKFSRDSRR